MEDKYSISNAAKVIGVSSELLRHYEREGIIAPERDGNGYRSYSTIDINKLMGVKKLAGMGFSLKEVRMLINSASFEQVKEMLAAQEEQTKKEIKTANVYIKRGSVYMENRKCHKCGSCEFVEGTDYMPIKPNKMSFSGSNKIYTFCLDCGEVYSIRIENTTIFKSK